MAYESPTYRFVEQIGDVELRRYEAHVVAETLVPGSLERAGNGGVRRLAADAERLAGDDQRGRTPTPRSEPIWARYDPPWTPWFQRRNEVLIAVADR